jgi:hypothetical protein
MWAMPTPGANHTGVKRNSFVGSVEPGTGGLAVSNLGDPWLCVPASRRVCLFQLAMSLISSQGEVITIKTGMNAQTPVKGTSTKVHGGRTEYVLDGKLTGTLAVGQATVYECRKKSGRKHYNLCSPTAKLLM